MIGAFVTFLVLFGLIKLFERGRDDLDNFNIAVVAIVPVIVVAIARFALALVVPDPLLAVLVSSLLLIALTFGLLWKNLGIPKGRSAAYTTVVVLVNEGLGLLLLAAA